MGDLSRAGARLLGVGILLWVAMLLITPAALASKSRPLSFGAAVVYAGGSLICHQRPDRCFKVSGRPMPVCARCTGLYLGAAVGAPFALIAGWGISSRRARRVVVLAALPTLLTWSVEMLGLAQPSNLVRAFCALPLGFAAAWLVMSAFRSPRAATVRAGDPMV
jgi:uncharacterized membrane protein